jgi:hypothetical protein
MERLITWNLTREGYGGNLAQVDLSLAHLYLLISR